MSCCCKVTPSVIKLPDEPTVEITTQDKENTESDKEKVDNTPNSTELITVKP